MIHESLKQETPGSATGATADELRPCPICEQHLSLVEFGICRARADGRNLYCKGCNRQKMENRRKGLREMRTDREALRRRIVVELESVGLERKADVLSQCNAESKRDACGILLPSELSNRYQPSSDRVLAAIHHGARTQSEMKILCVTLLQDEIGEALANLFLSIPRVIHTATVDGERIYFPAVPQLRVVKPEPAASFSALGGVMRPK